MMVSYNHNKTVPANLGDRYRRVVVITLAVTYMFNFLDRQLLSVLAQPIKIDLSLSDTQLGALTGLTFAIFYSAFGIPIAALADRGNRVRIVAIACGVWSLFSAASGLATNLLTLSLARIGVGIGEAGCSPPAYSIIADYFPPARRGGALAAYSIGVPFGSFFGIALGGWIAAHYGWRAAFLTVGAAGLILAPLIPLIVREPPRGIYDLPTEPGDQEKANHASIADALRFVVQSPALTINAVAAGFTAFVCYAILNWAPAFLMRVQGMSLSNFASIYGIVNAGSMALGLWLGGFFVDRFAKKNPALCALLPGLSIVLVAPFLFGMTAARSWQLSVALIVLPLILSTIYLAPAIVVVQNLTPTRYRATASAVLILAINLIGLGGGPLFVGAMSDRLTPEYGTHALGHALRWLTPFIGVAFVCHLASAWMHGLRHRRTAVQ
jgi:MFS family permease